MSRLPVADGSGLNALATRERPWFAIVFISVDRRLRRVGREKKYFCCQARSRASWTFQGIIEDARERA